MKQYTHNTTKHAHTTLHTTMHTTHNHISNTTLHTSTNTNKHNTTSKHTTRRLTNCLQPTSNTRHTKSTPHTFNKRFHISLSSHIIHTHHAYMHVYRHIHTCTYANTPTHTRSSTWILQPPHRTCMHTQIMNQVCHSFTTAHTYYFVVLWTDATSIRARIHICVPTMRNIVRTCNLHLCCVRVFDTVSVCVCEYIWSATHSVILARMHCLCS